MSEHDESVTLPLDVWANISNGKYESPDHALYEAAETGNTKLARSAITAGATGTLRQTGTGQVALMVASDKGHTKIVSLLIEAKVKLDPRDRWNRTPLTAASERNHTEIVRLLLNAGADPYLEDGYEKTAADYARENKNWDILKLLPPPPSVTVSGDDIRAAFKNTSSGRKNAGDGVSTGNNNSGGHRSSLGTGCLKDNFVSLKRFFSELHS